MKVLPQLGRALFGAGDGETLTGRARLAIAAAYVVLTIVGTVWLHDSREQPLLLDNQHYFFISERAASGVAPHASQFEPKHHASSLISAAGIACGRLVGLDDVRAGRCVSLLVLGLIVGVAWLLMLSMTQLPAAGHVTATAIWAFAIFTWHGSMGYRPKVFLVLFMLLALLALSRQRPLWAGVCAGLSHLSWQPGGIVLVAGLVVFLMGSDRWRRLAWMVGGFLATLAAYEMYFLVQGNLPQQLFQAYAYPAAYMSEEASGLTAPIDALQKLGGRWRRHFDGCTWVGFVFLVNLLLFWVWALVRPRKVWRFLRERPVWLGYGLCAHGTVAFTLHGHQGAPDLFFPLPFLAMGVGIAAGVFLKLARGRLWRLVGCAAVLLSMGWSLHVGVRGAAELRDDTARRGFTLADQYALAGEVAEIHEAGRSIYAVGCTHLLGMANLDNHIPFGFIFRGVEDYIDRRGTREFDPLDGVEPPDVVLASRLRGGRFSAWLNRGHAQTSAPAFARQQVKVYVQR